LASILATPCTGNSPTVACRCREDLVTWSMPHYGSTHVVNVESFLYLIARWGPVEGPCCKGDIDRDGWVDVSDMLIVLSYWGTSPKDFHRCHPF
jgi:hypothetical protein